MVSDWKIVVLCICRQLNQLNRQLRNPNKNYTEYRANYSFLKRKKEFEIRKIKIMFSINGYEWLGKNVAFCSDKCVCVCA